MKETTDEEMEEKEDQEAEKESELDKSLMNNPAFLKFMGINLTPWVFLAILGGLVFYIFTLGVQDNLYHDQFGKLCESKCKVCGYPEFIAKNWGCSCYAYAKVGGVNVPINPNPECLKSLAPMGNVTAN